MMFKLLYYILQTIFFSRNESFFTIFQEWIIFQYLCICSSGNIFNGHMGAVNCFCDVGNRAIQTNHCHMLQALLERNMYLFLDSKCYIKKQQKYRLYLPFPPIDSTPALIFVHVSFIAVPENPSPISPQYPFPPPSGYSVCF